MYLNYLFSLNQMCYEHFTKNRRSTQTTHNMHNLVQQTTFGWKIKEVTNNLQKPIRFAYASRQSAAFIFLISHSGLVH